MRLLLVDDDKEIRELVRDMFIKHGHQVIESWNGAQASRIFYSSHFDGVLTDYQMPVMNGLELVHEIREADPAIPIVMMSGDYSVIPPEGVPLLRKGDLRWDDFRKALGISL